MDRFTKWLQRFFDSSDELQSDLSQRWRLHANRRTIIVILVVGSLATFSYLYFIQPPDSFPVDQLVSVPEGASLKDISVGLQSGGVVRSALAFRVLVTLLGHERSVHAGDYLFKEPKDVFSVARSISIGAYGLEPVKIRIPEGATTRSMAIIYGSRLSRFDPQKFLAEAQPMEGYLFPDTYFFLPNATEDTVIKSMRQNFDIQEASIAPLVASSTHSLADIVTMASIVEREARNTQDRRMIAGVLWNRIKKGMPLQVDVTFLYTLGKGTFQLTMKDLTADSPYNTYKNPGLPPTPIGSPSLDSLEAAANPIKSDYLFYLADNSGVTHYSKTYAQHMQYKRMYLGN
ncbi:MAG: endolytic transglycosylase MltG [Candidatus Kaiserbacteria bacterium]|nr:endolytic transglycosylase MltG [Candidatus Kaiserbacteria bacterium]